MCGGGGYGPIDPTPPGASCPKEIVLEIVDIIQSGGEEVWDEIIEDGDEIEIEPDTTGKTLKVMLDSEVIGRIFHQLVYECITKRGRTYTGIIEKKDEKLIRLIRKA